VADPEDEADFEREYAKMMAESLESRKFERKQLFDVPLPVRPKNRENTTSTDAGNSNGSGNGNAPSNEGPPPTGHTMAFSLLTKKGNRQQTRTVELPSDSTFAIAMKNQQQAEKEEQQRIKNLVLNYDMQQSEDQEAVSNERPGTFYHNRIDRPTKDRGQRTRKLQLSDVDW
jgi:regulator of nonsense transcripts 2